MRDGSLVASHRTADVDAPRLVHDMVGRPLEQVYPRDAIEPQRSRDAGGPLCRFWNSRCHAGRHVSQREPHRSRRRDRGTGRPCRCGTLGIGPRDLRALPDGHRGQCDSAAANGGRPTRASPSRAGLVYVPEERKRQGLVLEHSLAEAISIGFSDRLTRFGLIRARVQRRRVAEAIKTYDIRAGNARQTIATLSGGNQQKALLARWLERGPELIILDEPTRGVDVGAKSQIHALVDSLAAKGKGILFISTISAKSWG